ncbi:MAG: hypothetical protein OEV91_05475, partial [Desulfobulbaceae bacterium]|nr:hypothetical protein [Desulfobulbaceae bacterium]
MLVTAEFLIPIVCPEFLNGRLLHKRALFSVPVVVADGNASVPVDYHFLECFETGLAFTIFRHLKAAETAIFGVLGIDADLVGSLLPESDEFFFFIGGHAGVHRRNLDSGKVCLGFFSGLEQVVYSLNHFIKRATATALFVSFLVNGVNTEGDKIDAHGHKSVTDFFGQQQAVGGQLDDKAFSLGMGEQFLAILVQEWFSPEKGDQGAGAQLGEF